MSFLIGQVQEILTIGHRTVSLEKVLAKPHENPLLSTAYTIIEFAKLGMLIPLQTCNIQVLLTFCPFWVFFCIRICALCSYGVLCSFFVSKMFCSYFWARVDCLIVGRIFDLRRA